MAAVTISNVRRLGQLPHLRGRAVLVTVTHTSSYATGGEDLPIASLRGLNTVDGFALVTGPTTTRFKGQAIKASTGVFAAPIFAGSTAAPKIKLVVGSTTQTEVANAANTSTLTYDLIVFGR